jgi:hypothetical protein
LIKALLLQQKSINQPSGMKKLKICLLLFCVFQFSLVNVSAMNLKGATLNFVCKDAQFKNPFIDKDVMMKAPVRCRYIHGGFDDGTRFSFYYPEKKSYAGHFFQYVTPFPDSETSAQAYPADINPISFSITHGAYFVETNEGGKLDFTDNSTKREASIGAYRANAACAELSRYIANKLYDCSRPYGYCFGGSGGAYRTIGSMESTTGIWDGAVPFVLGSPNAIPMVFAVRMYALRILKDKLADIIDAMDAGGSGDPYATLNVEQRQVLLECSKMGFPLKSWYGWPYMDVHGFLVLYKSVVAMDEKYFHEDFWNKPGYLGYDNPPSLQRDRVQTKSVVRRIIGQEEAERLGLVKALSASERGTADRAWASMGSEIKDKPVAYQIDVNVKDIGMGGDLIILSGKGKGTVLQVAKTSGNYVALAPVNEPRMLSQLHVGDSVQVDNSDFLAVQTYYRHQAAIGRLLRVESVPRQQRSTDLSATSDAAGTAVHHGSCRLHSRRQHERQDDIVLVALGPGVICLAGRLVSQPREETFGRRKCREQFPSVVHRPCPAWRCRRPHAVGFLSDHHLSGIARHQRLGGKRHQAL